MALCENTIAFSLTLVRDLLSFENWRRGGGQKGFVVGALPPPLATALCKLLVYIRKQYFDCRL